MNISHTVLPPVQMSEQEWMDAFKVSSQVAKYDGQARARHIMEQWQEGKTESIWKKVISKLNVNK